MLQFRERCFLQFVDLLSEAVEELLPSSLAGELNPHELLCSHLTYSLLRVFLLPLGAG